MRTLRPIRRFARPPESRLVREHRFHEAFVGGLVATERYLVSSSEDAHIAMFDIETGEHLANLYGHDGPVNFLTLTPDGALLSAGDDRLVREWDLDERRSVRRYEGHSDYVSRVYPAGRDRFVSASRDQKLGLFDRETGEGEFLPGHSAWVYGLAASPDGKRAVSASLNTQMIAWDLEAGTIEQWIVGEDSADVVMVHGMYITPDNTSGVGHETSINTMAWSSDGETVVSAAKDVIVWDTAGWTERQRLSGHPWGTNALALFDGGAKLITVGRNVKVWDTATGELLASFEGHGDRQIKSVAIDPRDRWFFTGDEDGVVRQWDVDEVLRQGPHIGHMNRVYPTQISDDERLLISGSCDATGMLWSVETGELLHPFSGHPEVFVTAGCFRRDGAEVVTGSRGQLRRWDTSTGELLDIVQCDVDLYGFEAIVQTADPDVLFCSDTIRRPTLWNLETGEIQPCGAPSAFNSAVALTADRRFALTSCYFKREDVISGDALSDDDGWQRAGAHDEDPSRCPAQLWDLVSGALVRAYPLNGLVSEDTKEYPFSVALSPDERSVYVGSSSGLLYGFDRDGSMARFEANAHTDAVNLVHVLPDGRICTAARAPELVVWSPDGERLTDIVVPGDEARHWAVSPDGRWVVAATGSRILLIDVLEGTVVAQADVDGEPSTLRVTTGANRIVVGLHDGRVGFLRP